MGSWFDRTMRARSFALLVLLIAGLVWEAPAVGAHQRAAQSCAALGAYRVGTRLVPMPQPSATVPVYPYWGGLQGQITLSAYTGCGTPTAGTFAVHLAYRPLPIDRSGSGVPRVTPPASTGVAVPLSATTVLSATGTFTQDATHGTDPAYVQISATITYGRVPPYYCGRVCPQPGAGAQVPCPPEGCTYGRVVVTRVATAAAIMGFLRWQESAPAQLGLAFLPPPDPAGAAAAMLSLQPIAFVGQRAG